MAAHVRRTWAATASRACRGARAGRAPVPAARAAAAGAERDAGAGPGAGVERVDVLSPRRENRVRLRRCGDVDALLRLPEEYDALPHVAVAGRVNAGKSSFCNHLLRKSNLSKASSVAGRTDAVNLLLCNEQFVLADLPGYPAWDGDRRVPRDWVARLRPLIRDYLRLGAEAGEGEGAEYFDLRALLWLHDVRWRITEQDVQFARMAEDLGVPTLLILTKDDRVGGHAERQRRTEEIRAQLAWTLPHVHYCADSSLPAGRKARKQVQRYIRTFVSAGSREECAAALAGAWGGRGGGGAAGTSSGMPSV